LQRKQYKRRESGISFS